jgi:hypothetical protein
MDNTRGVTLILQQFEIKPATKMVNFKNVKKGDYLEISCSASKTHIA